MAGEAPCRRNDVSYRLNILKKKELSAEKGGGFLLFLYLCKKYFNEICNDMKKTLFTIITVAGMMLAMPANTMAANSAVELIDLDVQDITLTYGNGVMHITGANNQVVTIYNLAGIAVKSFRVDGVDKRISLPLSDGVYIIKVGPSFTRKITVRR